jgi:hypothetical protein
MKDRSVIVDGSQSKGNLMFLKRTSVLSAALAVAVALFAVPAVASQNARADTDRSYLVTVENLTDYQSLTPAVVATHNGGSRVFRVGGSASDGLQQLAENGGVPVLAGELAATSGFDAVEVAGAAPIGPGESVSVLITAGPGVWRLSAATMLICTNDGFGGVGRLTLPRTYGAVHAGYGVAYDAGTEINTENYADLVPPCDGLGETGETNPDLAQNGVVRPHKGIKGNGDLDAATHDWNEPVVKVSVERVDVYEVTVENLTDTQSFTPFVFATHRKRASIFEPGAVASSGLQQLAENGGVPVLTGELENEYGFGTVTVIGSAPIAPGATETVEVFATGGYRFASLVGMLICTNDGFGGISTARLPNLDATSSLDGGAYDAGTELNTENYADLVPPCDGLGQTGETNSALAQNGVVSVHGGIVGGADLSAETHGWADPVVKLEITRTG